MERTLHLELAKKLHLPGNRSGYSGSVGGSLIVQILAIKFAAQKRSPSIQSRHIYPISKIVSHLLIYI